MSEVGRPPEGPRRPRLTDEERAALGEPPGRKAWEERRAREAAERELARLDEAIDEVERFRMPLMDHLVELRDRLIVAVGALILAMIISLVYAADILAFLTAPFEESLSSAPGIKGGLSMVHSPFEGVYTYLKVSFVGGVLLAMPIVAYQIWAFIAPGLYNRERRIVLPLTLTSTVLFVSGAAFCYYVLFPFAFPFFIGVLNVDVNLSIDGYLDAVIKMMLAFGASFQLPIGTFFLASLGHIDARDMAGGFRYAVVGIFVVAAILTPPDPLTQILLAIPLVILYGISIAVAWVFSTKTREAEVTEAT